MSSIDASQANLVNLISSYLSGKVDAPRFSKDYMHGWRYCRDSGRIELLNSLSNNAFDRIFTAIDCYCDNPALRSSDDFDERQLFDEVNTIVSTVPAGVLESIQSRTGNL